MTSPLKLYGSYTSPFVRKLRLLLWGNKNLEFIAINYLEENDGKLLKDINPLNQIPLLIDGEQKVYDSRIIFNYLAAKMKLVPMSIEDENRLSAIDTAMSSGVSLFSIRKGGIDIVKTDHYYIIRQKERLPSIFHYLAPWVKTLDPKKDWNYLSMSLYSLVYWLELRDIYHCQSHPEIGAFMERFKECPGVQETNPPTV